MRKFALITFVFLITIIGFQNLTSTPIQLLIWQVEFSIGFWTILVFLAGIVLGIFIGYFSRKKSLPQNSSSSGNNLNDDFLNP